MKHGAEFTSYRPEDVERVRRVLDRHRGPHLAATEVALAEEAGMPERRFRSVMTEHDGIEWAIGKCAGGIFLARTPAEAASLTAELRSKTSTLGERLRRRDRFNGWAAPEQLTLQGVA